MRRYAGKYGSNRKAVCHQGHQHDSNAEGRHCDALHLRQAAGQISDLEVFPVYRLTVNDEQVYRYTADFRYRERGALVVADVKSQATRKKEAFRIVARLFHAIHGCPITIVPSEEV